MIRFVKGCLKGRSRVKTLDGINTYEKTARLIKASADLLGSRTGLAKFADILVTTPALEDVIDPDGPPAVFVKNIFSENEIEEKLNLVLKEVMANKKQ